MPAEHDARLIEPYDSGELPIRWKTLCLALFVAAALFYFAPKDWAAGKAELVFADGSNHSAPVLIEPGLLSKLEFKISLAGISYQVNLPQGIPLDNNIIIKIQADHIKPNQLFPANLEIYIKMPDRKAELIPVVQSDSIKGRYIAQRIPPNHSRVLLALIGMVIVLWISEAIPLYVTSLLIPVVITLFGASSATAALAPFFHPIIALFLGGFLLAESMRRVGLDQIISMFLIGKTGKTPIMLFGVLLFLASFLSMWMSNTAAAAVLIPIALTISRPLANEAYSKTLVLGIAYAATIGGVASAIGTPANPLAIEFLKEFTGRSISFIEWFAFGLPMLVLFLPIMGIFLWISSGCQVDPLAFNKTRAIALKKLGTIEKLNRSQWQVLIVFMIVMSLWLTQQFHGLSTGIVALFGVVLLAIQNLLKPEDLNRISWASLLTFGGGLALGQQIVLSGTSDWLASNLSFLTTLPAWLGITAIAFISLGLTTAASNTAAAAIMIPLSLPLAGIMQIDPVILVVVVAIASSVDFALVIGTPPTMIAYSTNLFTAKEIFIRGFWLDIIGIIILITAVVACWKLMALV